MSLCVNPDCPQPQNPEAHRFCHGCGARLRLGDRHDSPQGQPPHRPPARSR